MQETQKTRVQSLSHEEPLEKGMASRSSMLAWKIPRAEEPSGLQSMGLQRVGHSSTRMHSPCTQGKKGEMTNIQDTLFISPLPWDPSGALLLE